MPYYYRKQAGFGAIESLLVIIAVTLIGFTSYYIWHTQTVTNKNLSPVKSTVTSSPKAKVDANTDAYAGWQSYSKPALKVSFKYPKDWTVEESEPQCTGAQQVVVDASDADIAKAAAAMSTPELKIFYISITQYGTQSSRCSQDGTNFTGNKYKYLASSDQLSTGVFKNSSITFFGGTDDPSKTQADTGLLTNNNYTSQGAFNEAGTVTAHGHTYQIMINTDTGQYQQDMVPVALNVAALKNTDLYRKMYNLLQSMQ